MLIFLIWSLLLFSACSRFDRQRVDKLNDLSYAYHYRNIDSTVYFANKALGISSGYDDGKSEALNNLAFASIIRMDYDKAKSYLDEASAATNNQIEALISEVQYMRLCQRMSRNREFYYHRQRAADKIKRINEERKTLSARSIRRMVYAESEFAIVTSTYYYYVGLNKKSAEALNAINPEGEIKNDTAQYLSYLYNIGSGGIITGGTSDEVLQREFDALSRCFFIAYESNYPFFEANSLASIAEHIIYAEDRRKLLSDNYQVLSFITPNNIEEHNLPYLLADRALALFADYGDIYQTAGALRTLASCYMASGYYDEALLNLEKALGDKRISQAPDLVASIREQLSVAYSAIDNKPKSDYNRNIYLDLQEQTRQDRFYEARVEQLERETGMLNIMIAAVIFAIVLLLFFLWLFYHLIRIKKRKSSLDYLLEPLNKWEKDTNEKLDIIKSRSEDLSEQYSVSQQRKDSNERLVLENRARLSLITGLLPFVDRILNELSLLTRRKEGDDVVERRYSYIIELSEKIQEYNSFLTQWIKIRHGMYNLNIQSFELDSLFELIKKSRVSFDMCGIELDVLPCGYTVKGDKVLTLFMINTLADNARKFSSPGGKVTISAEGNGEYVEIAVEDTGIGMTACELERVLGRSVISSGHGFGLTNCKGIIEKYKKISDIFNVCTLAASSEKGKGSKFFFRLPYGVKRVALILVSCFSLISSFANSGQPSIAHSATYGNLEVAKAYADSAYFSNINGTYSKTLVHVDSCLKHLNAYYLKQNENGKALMQMDGEMPEEAPEIAWYHDSVAINYNLILDIRNECAVAALALHQWHLYDYNNKIFTRLYKELSADSTLQAYCLSMQTSKTNKTVAVVLLVIILIAILTAYYLIYYKNILHYRLCIENVKQINAILLSDSLPYEKLKDIELLSTEQYPYNLREIVEKIKRSLGEADRLFVQNSYSLELAEDELRKIQYEEHSLYICNSVVDNCLSAFKHETMYYPDRIRHLVNTERDNLKYLTELVTYYRDLYMILSKQASRQMDNVSIRLSKIDVAGILPDIIPAGKYYVVGNRNLLRYMLELLTNNLKLPFTVTKPEQFGDGYIELSLLISGVPFEDGVNLFVPCEANIPFLLCKQIIRDLSEVTNRRGAGIQAQACGGKLSVRLVLPSCCGIHDYNIKDI